MFYATPIFRVQHESVDCKRGKVLQTGHTWFSTQQPQVLQFLGTLSAILAPLPASRLLCVNSQAGCVYIDTNHVAWPCHFLTGCD